jgi:hypothetical protein
MIKQYLEQYFGLDTLREAAIAAKKELDEAKDAAIKAKEEATKAKEEATKAKLTPKEIATQKGEPYIAVLETHVNKENIRNGFFELDWNDEFVVQLKQAGYGYDGDPDEEIVDRWFRALCHDVASEAGVDMTDRGSGFINVRKLMNNKSEIS